MSAEGSHPSEDRHPIDPEGCGGNAAPYVLGALTEEEHEVFRRHIESCAVCREEVAALQVVASALPAAAPQLSAPPELKQRVMASVYEDARRREAQDAVAAERPARRPRAAKRPARGGWLGLRANLAVTGLAVAAVLALAVVVLSSGGGTGTKVIRAQVLVPRASASLSVAGGHAQLSIADMPQAGPGRVYEVWREGSGAPQPTDALFTVSSSGDATVGVPGGVAGVKAVLVTSEPLGGSRVPTRMPVIVARVS
jgi:anti-sigma-K factor RskA